MQYRMRAAAGAVAMLLIPACSAGQIPATRPSAAEIVSAVVTQGHLGGWYDYIDFAGCPQADTTGAEVLDLIGAESGLGDGVVAGLLALWTDEFHACASSTLDAWYLGAIQDLLTRGSVYVPLVLDALPPTLRSDLDALLRAFVADTSGSVRARTEVANAVLDRLGPAEQRDTFLSFMTTVGLPADWISSWSGHFTQVAMGTYVSELAQRSGGIDDQTLLAAIGTVRTGVALGALQASDPSLASLADAISGRSALADLHDALLLTIEPPTESTVAAVADTYLKQGTPNKNQGSEDVLRIRSSGKNRALVYVSDADLAALPSTIVSARLEFDIVFNANNWGTEGRTVDVHRMLVPWTHSGATWNCADDLNPENSAPDCETSEWEMRTLDPPPFAVTPTGTLLITRDLTGTASIDVTADVRAFRDGTAMNYGWIIKKTNEGQAGHIDIASLETGDGPRLVLVGS